ncbi:undecaprenyl-diphosphate phosphatase [Candidatus Babeliales bacterium]|nr:undecaprenyl-diphosphate phosphatase [Candidatus Babeliales bacterium]MCF7899836.1 undecaprenyl-diphosphate phosphatase [Candidatus Babeliales bacterium]
MSLFLFIIFFQIIIESFPVSSSGHVLLIEKLFAKLGYQTNLQLPNFFDHFLHGPTILIIILLFYKDWSNLIFNLVYGFFNKNFRNKDSYKNLLNIFLKLILYLFISSAITLCFWILDKFINFKNNNFILLSGFCITALLLISLLFKKKLCIKKISYFKKYIFLGLIQGFALIMPGVSRFASTYVLAYWLGFAPRRAFQTSFLLEMPLIIPAFFLGFYKMTKFSGWQNLFDLKTCLTFIVATIISFFALLFMQKLAINRKLGFMAFYMLIPILILIFIVF